MTDTITLDQLNSGDDADFLTALGDVFEHSPWLVERASTGRPFPTRDALIAALLDIMTAAAEEEKLALIRAHPDLAGKAARAGDLTEHSAHEQSSVGLDRLSDEDYERFSRLNDAYKQRFGFPFIIAVLDHTKDSILAEFDTRLQNGTSQEIDEAIRNIGRIVSLRVLGTVSE